MVTELHFAANGIARECGRDWRRTFAVLASRAPLRAHER
jgi:hypothetical protein